MFKCKKKQKKKHTTEMPSDRKNDRHNRKLADLAEGEKVVLKS